MKTFTGTVLSTKMQQTATVSVESRWQHPTYKKTVKRSKNYLAHNSRQAHEGDLVEIIETKPISKRKKWAITKIIKKAVRK